MAIIRIKTSSTTPTLEGLEGSNILKIGEMGYTYVTGDSDGGDRLFIGVGPTNANGYASQYVTIGGEYHTGLLSAPKGKIQPERALIVDANAKLQTQDLAFKVDDLELNENTISSTSGALKLSGFNNTIDMDSDRLINVANPTQNQDAATKHYVDNLDLVVGNADENTSGDGILIAGDKLNIIGDDNILTKRRDIPDGVEIQITLESAPINLSSMQVGDMTIGNNQIISSANSPIVIDAHPQGSGGRVIIQGDLQVDGTTTTINSTELTINDKNIVLADSAADANAADSAGITVGGANAQLFYKATADTWNFNRNVLAPNITLQGPDGARGSIDGSYAGFDSDLLQTTTAGLPEDSATNFYYTTARVDSAFDVRFLTKTTDSLAEGLNLYYTDARFDSALATKTTTDLAEGDNLYYTTARHDSDFDVRIATKSTTDVAEGTNLYYTTGRHDSDTLAQVDSSYVQTRQDYAYSSLTGVPTNVSTFTNDANYLDSTTVQGVIDASYVTGLIDTTYLDSSEVIDLVDSAYVNARVNSGNFLDSAEAIALVDSAYVQARQTPQDFAYSSLTGAPTNVSTFINDANYLDSTTVLDVVDQTYVRGHVDAPYVQSLIDTTYLDSAEAIALVDSAYVQDRQDYAYSSLTGTPTNVSSFTNDANYLDSTTVTGVIDQTYVTGLIDASYLDSSEAIALIDSNYIQARQLDSAGTATLALNAQKLNAQDASFYLDYNNLANAPTVLDTVDVSNIITNDVDSAFVNALPNINADKLDGYDAQFFIDKIDSNVSGFDSVQGNFHVTGDLDVSGNVDLLSHPVPAYRRGRLFYDSDHHTLAYFSDVEGVVHQIGIEEHQRVFNNTGYSIPKGQPLYFSGNYGDSNNLHVPTVGLADATDVNAYNAQGLSAEVIPNQSFGYCIIAGQLTNVNTGSLEAGKNFFVGLTPGAIQNASPVYPNFPMCLGWVVKASDPGDSNGVLLLNQQNHSVNSFRVRTSAHVGQNLQVDGNLTVLGTQTAVSTADVTAGSPFFRLNEGNAIGEAGTTYQGTGVDDAFFSGFMKGPSPQTYYVRIDGKGTGPGGVDTFEVAFGNDSQFASPHLTKVPITTQDQMIHSIDNISIKFASTTGHDSGDRWSGIAAPINIDTGFWTNRNTGASGVGFTYMGLWYDVSDDKWKLVEEYDSDPAGTINASDSSFVLGTLQARVFEGNMSGSVTGTVSDISNHTTTGLPEGNNLYYTTARHDSDTLVQVDSAYVQLRLGDLVDSADVIQLVDSSYVQARLGNLLDSVDAIQLIDSAHVQARLGDLVDSADVIQIVDSSYVVARASGAIAGSNDFLRKAGGGTIVGDLRVEDSSGNAKLILDSNFALYRSEAPGLGVGLVSHADGINIGGTLNGHLIPSGAGTFALTSQIIDSATIQELSQEVNVDSAEVLNLIASSQLEATSGISTPSITNVKEGIEFSYDSAHDSAQTTWDVTVSMKDSSHRYFDTGSPSGYIINGKFAPFLQLVPGTRVRFNQSDNSNTSHPIRFYLDAAKQIEWTTGVSNSGISAGTAGSYVNLDVTDSTPSVLHYQCQNHGYMGNALFAPTHTLKGFDSSDYAPIIDSGYINDRVDAGTDSATVIALIDSDYVQARQTAGTDSAATIALINATVDSAYVNLMQPVAQKGTITHNKFHFTSGSGQTYFSGADSASTIMTIIDQKNIEVYVNGLTQRLGKDFNVDSNSITFTYGVSNGASVSVTELVGRSDVKSTLVETTFEFDADSGQTVFTGADADGVILDLASGVVQVFLNGFLLSAENDYTLSTDTITLFDSADSGDLLAISVLDANVSSSLNTKQHIFENVSGTILKRGGFDFAGNVQVFKNGDILKENFDYTTQGGNQITLVDAAVGSDVFVISTFAAQDYNAKTFDFLATAGQTTFQGADRRGEELKYMASGLNVFLNGIALVDSSDYTAQNGVSVVMSTAVDSGDEVKITTFVPSTMASIAVPLSKTAFEFTATPNQSTFSGTDDNGLTLAYEANKVDVHLNGLLLKSNDFTATNGTSVSLTEAADSGDILTVTKFVGNNIGVDSSAVQTIIDNDVRHNWSVWSDSGELALNSQNIVNSSAKAIQLTLPFTPSQGDEIRVIDGNGTSATNNITLRRNGKNIMGAGTDFVIDVDRAAVGLVYYDVGNGWILKEN